MKFKFFYTFVGYCGLLDPDPDSESGSGSTDPIYLDPIGNRIRHPEKGIRTVFKYLT
jgi:hypothetical protein